METMISLKFNNVKKCTFIKYLSSDKSELDIFNRKVVKYIKQNPIEFSSNIKSEDRVFLNYQKYINHILKDSNNELIDNCNNIFSIIKRKYYGSFHGSDIYKISCIITKENFVVFVSNDNGKLKYFDVASKKEFDKIRKMMDKRCCISTKHAMDRLRVRSIGKVKNLYCQDLSKYEENLINYINENSHVLEVKLKEKYRIVNLLNNNLEESKYYTDNKMVFVVSNKVLITSYSYWEDKYEVIS